jgi:Protein of unknown function (DUF3017)
MVDQPGQASVPQVGPDHRKGPRTGSLWLPVRAWTGFWERRKANRGRPLPPIRPWPRRQWPLLVVVAGIFVSLVVVLVVDFRPGTVMFAVSVLVAAGFRLVLTTRRAGLLVLRSRAIDVATLTIMGISALLLALAVPDIR